MLFVVVVAAPVRNRTDGKKKRNSYSGSVNAAASWQSDSLSD
jgi:hypothetical protein